ncbi:MAG TPA: oligosaccharide flippase family protein, partial [Bacteroidia bacterium]|nr:oligosaccharide flippase family protein [Bacteroidia bacterium]
MAASEHKEYYRNLITLVTGSAFAQLISLALSPVFSRIYSPHEFGLLAVFMSILSALSVIVCLRYEFAIIPARTGKDAFHLLELCFYSTLLTTILTLIGVTIYNLFISTNTVLSKWFWFLPFMVLINGSYQAMLSWANRHKSYKVISRYRITNSVITNIIILGAGLAGFISMGLLAGFVSGGAVAAIMLYFNIQKQSEPFKLGFNLAALKNVAKKYEAFPKVNLWQSIADMLLINGVIYFLTAFFSPAVVGLYGLTMRVLQAPFNLIGYSMGQVFIQDAAHQYNEGKNIQPIIKKSIQRTAFIALPIVLPLIFAGPQLFQFVFG